MIWNLSRGRTLYETWNISKHTATGVNGIVVAQEIEARNIGKDVLLTGGMQ